MAWSGTPCCPYNEHCSHQRCHNSTCWEWPHYFYLFFYFLSAVQAFIKLSGSPRVVWRNVSLCEGADMFLFLFFRVCIGYVQHNDSALGKLDHVLGSNLLRIHEADFQGAC